MYYFHPCPVTGDDNVLLFDGRHIAEQLVDAGVTIISLLACFAVCRSASGLGAKTVTKALLDVV